MKKKAFSKVLSANDVGSTGGHQGGILIPKSEAELLEFLPALDQEIKNPDAWLECVDEKGVRRKFRFVYYNNKLHDANGTRNEYRITYMTNYFRELGACAGEALEISARDEPGAYNIRILREVENQGDASVDQGVRIKIKSAWRRAH
jgi:hypothetical protein